MIRWIRDHLGTAPRDEMGEGAFTILDVRHLVDKGGNSPALILQLIEQGTRTIKSGGTVVVCCDFGISRSNAIAAGILATTEALSFDQALQTVIAKTGEREIKLDLSEAVRSAMGGGKYESGNQSVLVTGASGFIGQKLVECLGHSCRVLGPSRSELNLDDGAVALAEYCSREKVGQIIHLAYPREYTNAAAAASSLVMIRAVLDTCRLLKIRLIFVSGWVVFSGYPSVALIADESLNIRPKGVYAETKAAEEMLVDLHYQRGDIQRTICRLAPVYGPGGLRPRFIGSFYQRAKSGQTISTHKFRNGRPSLDLLYIEDAAEGISKAALHPDNEIFHFGTGELHSTSDLAKSIARIAGHSIDLHEIEIDDFTSNIAFPAEKASRILGWSPRIRIEEGLRAMLLNSKNEVI